MCVHPEISEIKTQSTQRSDMKVQEKEVLKTTLRTLICTAGWKDGSFTERKHWKEHTSLKQ